MDREDTIIDVLLIIAESSKDKQTMKENVLKLAKRLKENKLFYSRFIDELSGKG